MKYTSNLIVNPAGIMSGKIQDIPGDKSITHRALILSALASQGSRIRLFNWLSSLDCKATLVALNAMGVQYNIYNQTLEITSVGLHGLQDPAKTLDVGNSGTSIRLLTGVLCAQKFSNTITGDASICRRPMQRVIIPLTMMGAKIAAINNEFAPLQITGGQALHTIEYAMPVASAQVKSAVLLASLYAQGSCKITAPSICRDHTELMLQYFAEAKNQGEIDYHVPGDFSSAAFFIVGATIAAGSDLLLKNIGINPTRTALLQILLQMGADITILNEHNLHNEWRADIRIKAAKKLTALTVPQELIANAIDELPVLCLAAACANGTTVIRGARELRYKESDRIALMAQGLSALGIRTSIFEDGLAVTGGVISGGRVCSGGDHRIAMTFALAGLVAQDLIMVQDTENIATSFPNFVAVARQAGLKIQEQTHAKPAYTYSND